MGSLCAMLKVLGALASPITAHSGVCAACFVAGASMGICQCSGGLSLYTPAGVCAGALVPLLLAPQGRCVPRALGPVQVRPLRPPLPCQPAMNVATMPGSASRLFVQLSPAAWLVTRMA